MVKNISVSGWRRLALGLFLMIPGLVFSQPLVVNTTDDTDDGACDAMHCSLREAIVAANGNPGQVTFELSGGTPYVIALRTALPVLTGAGTTIDGRSQPAGVIILDGGALDPDGQAAGLVIQASDISVYGLQIRDFPEAGIAIKGARRIQVGSADSGRGNVLTGNRRGILLAAGAREVTIQGNRIGVLPGGGAAGNETGIFIDGLESTVEAVLIGGVEPEQGNLISGNAGSGIFGRQVSNITLLNNYIGTDLAGTAPLANGLSGVDLSDAEQVFIGQPGAGNLLSGNREHGVILRRLRSELPVRARLVANLIGVDGEGRAALPNEGSGIVLDGVAGVVVGSGAPEAANTVSGNFRGGIIGTATRAVTVVGNLIGTGPDGITAIGNGNDGIRFENSASIIIGRDAGNVIGANLGNGIVLNGCLGGVLAGNSIGIDPFENGLGNRLAGIRLSNCRNASTAGNVIGYNGEGIRVAAGSQECLISSNRLFCNGRGIILEAGTNGGIGAPTELCVLPDRASGQAPAGSIVEVFILPAATCPNLACQGRILAGSTTAGAGGSWSLGGSFLPGDKVTATATDAGNNTSAYAECATVLENALTAEASNGGPYCEGESIELSGSGFPSGDLEYHWTGPGGFSASTPTTESATQGGIYELVVQFEGCRSGPASTEVIVVTEINVTIGDDPEEWICPGESMVVNGTVYNEENPRGRERIPVSGSCDTLIMIDLQFLPAATGRLDTLVCPGTSVVVAGEVFNAERPAGEMRFPGGATNGCDSVLEVQLQFRAFISETLVFGVSCPGAADGEAALLGISGGAPPYTYRFDSAAPKPLPDFPLRFSNLEAGDYQLIVEDDTGCRIVEVLEVEPPPALFLDLGPDVDLAFGDSLLLMPRLNFEPDSIRWSPADELSCTNCLRPVAAPDRTNSYRLEVVSPGGCRLRDELTVRVDRERLVYVPNAFSPNNDGINDRFNISGNPKSIRRIRSLRIFDRWGNLLYEGVDLPFGGVSSGWDGNYRGREAPQGVYVVALEVELANGDRTLIGGEVVLVR